MGDIAEHGLFCALFLFPEITKLHFFFFGHLGAALAYTFVNPFRVLVLLAILVD